MFVIKLNKNSKSLYCSLLDGLIVINFTLFINYCTFQGVPGPQGEPGEKGKFFEYSDASYFEMKPAVHGENYNLIEYYCVICGQMEAM